MSATGSSSVAQHLGENTVRCIAMDSTEVGARPGSDRHRRRSRLPVGPGMLGPSSTSSASRSVTRPARSGCQRKHLSAAPEYVERDDRAQILVTTASKVLDLLAPYTRRRIDLFGGAASARPC